MFHLQQAVKFVKKFAKITACILFITACDKLNSPKNQPLNTVNIEQHQDLLTRAIYASHFELDPHKVKNSAEAAPLRDLLVGLLAFNQKGEIIPAIAQSWFSEDQKEWLFILDEKATWSNGEKVTAHDFVASWQRLATPENLSPLAKYLTYMDIENAAAIHAKQKPASDLGVVALNEHSLQIRLNRPNALFPKMLAHTALLPTYRGEQPTAQHLVSNADYMLETIDANHLKLKAKKAGVAFKNVIYTLLTPEQPSQDFDIIENPLFNQTTNIVKFPQLCSYYYEFNFNDPQLAKKEIRQALKLMISSGRIGQEYGIPSQSVIPHHLVKDHERQWKPVLVEQLLTKSGITPKHPLTLTLTYDEASLHSDIAKQITRTLSQSELFNIHLKAVDWETLNQLRQQKAYQLMRAGWCADYPDPAIFLVKFHSKSPDNYMNYRNPEVDLKLERLAENLTMEERNQLINEINELLYEDSAVLPLFQYQHRMTVVPSLLGIDLNNDSEVIYSKDLKRILTNKDQVK